jgi:hypothetical protein
MRLLFALSLGALAACSPAGGTTVPIDPAESAGATCMGKSCDDLNACTRDVPVGDGCSVTCEHEPITDCGSGDGCCPAGCSATNDGDCTPSCGNGAIDPGEVCDGNCPSCNDGNACTIDYTYGSSSTCDRSCDHEAMTGCLDGDGCCPGGCNVATDDDCPVACGNGVVDPGETCDQACPVYCADGNACTTDLMTGSPSTCNVACTFTPITTCVDGDGCCGGGCTEETDDDCSADDCGNGVTDPGETCDASCPTSCNDGEACTIDTLTGSPASCNAHCTFTPVSECDSTDGCCPDGCTEDTDDDCIPPPTETECDDGLDNDDDGFADCEDDNCDGDVCDANACTTSTCQFGTCVVSDTTSCTSTNPCLIGSCDATNGCMFIPQPNGFPCGAGMSCLEGACVPTCTPTLAFELCNNLDDDCDGAVDEGAFGAGAPCDGPDSDLCEEGVMVCSGGALTCSDSTAGNLEVCTLPGDEDCDGAINEGCIICGDGACLPPENAGNCAIDCGL